MLAAARASERGQRTLLLEKNRKPGVKILMSGGTRCNLTHATDARGIVDAFGTQGRFLHSALAALGPAALVALIEAEGVATKVEETGKIFPVSDRATDVLEALLRRLRRSGCTLALEEPLLEVVPHANGFRLTTARQILETRSVIIASGGKSYPGCGTTGDGFAWAAALGHTIEPPRPALTPITSDPQWIYDLRGVTVTDTLVRVRRRAEAAANGGRKNKPEVLAERRGSFLFTHFGLSGPAALDVSRAVTAEANPRALDLECDFLPASGAEDVDQWLRDEMQASGKRQIASLLSQRLPRRLADVLVQQAELHVELRLAELAKDKRRALVARLKQTQIPISGTRGFKKAEVTAGGVSLTEIDSKTMQSKLVPNFYLCGEVLDLDGPIGGYNFQAAFSTGWLAGSSV